MIVIMKLLLIKWFLKPYAYFVMLDLLWIKEILRFQLQKDVCIKFISIAVLSLVFWNIANATFCSMYS